MWVSGSIHESCAQRWRALLVVPLKKGDDGSDVRAVLISEVLLSIPSRVLKASAHSRVVKLLHPTQFGIGIAGGAEAMQLELDIRTRLHPDMALLSVDISNAFGEVTRACVLEEELKHDPGAVCFTVTMWGETGTPAYVEVGPGEWRTLLIKDGLYIGEVRASQHFCLALRDALREFVTECQVLFGPGFVRHIEYIDDVYVHLPPNRLPQAWTVLVRALARKRLTLNLSKVGVWIPQEEHGVNPYVEQVGLRQHHHSVVCLGGALGGDLAFRLGGQLADVPEPTVKRIAKFHRTAEALEKLISTETALPRLRAAWCLLQFVLNRALDFDVRILHQAAFGQLASEVDQRVEGIAARILGEVSIDSCKERVRILTAHGGGGLASYADKSTCGYLMAARQVAAGVGQRLTAEGNSPDQVNDALARRVLPGCRACQETLAAIGVHLRPGGDISRLADGSVGVSSWLGARPACKQADALRLLSEIRAETLASGLTEEERAHLMAAGGDGAGSWHAEIPAHWQRPTWSDPVFRVALRFRLGLRVLPLPRDGEGESTCSCGKAMDSMGWHSLLCNKGPWTCARHNVVVRILASIAKEAGYVALVEQHVPQLGFRSRRRAGVMVTEAARLDVVCSCHAVAPDRLYDVSVRNAVSSRALAKGSARRPAVAAGLALEDKRARYPAQGGVEVFCFALETAGRFHPAADEELQRLADLARDRLTERGVRPGAMLRRWRHQVQAALFRSIAASLLSAASTSDGGTRDVEKEEA